MLMLAAAASAAMSMVMMPAMTVFAAAVPLLFMLMLAFTAAPLLFGTCNIQFNFLHHIPLLLKTLKSPQCTSNLPESRNEKQHMKTSCLNCSHNRLFSALFLPQSAV